MSFIYNDKNILNLIRKMAVEVQSDGGPKVSENLINKLFENLRKSTSDDTSSLKGDGGFNSVSISNIANLENYLSFLNSKNVTFSGSPIASTTVPANNSASYKSYKLTDRDFFVHLDGLKNHVLLLFKSPDYKTRPLYREMLGRLVAQIKVAFGIDIPLPDMGDDTEIIRLPADVNIDRPYSPGDKILRVKDLANFKSWFDGNISSVKQNGKDFSPKDNGLCPLLEYIHKNVSSAENKAKILACGQANKCPWAGSGPSTPQSTVPSGGASQPGGGSSMPGNINDAFRKITAILESGGPFYRGEIRFGSGNNDTDSNTLFSFINNCIIYFSYLEKSGSDQNTQEQSSILSILYRSKSILDSVKGFTGNQMVITRTTTIPSLLTMPKDEYSKADRQNKLYTAKSVLDDILDAVRLVCQHLNKMNLLDAQKSNQIENKNLLDQLFIANTRSL